MERLADSFYESSLEGDFILVEMAREEGQLGLHQEDLGEEKDVVH